MLSDNFSSINSDTSKWIPESWGQIILKNRAVRLKRGWIFLGVCWILDISQLLVKMFFFFLKKVIIISVGSCTLFTSVIVEVLFNLMQQVKNILNHLTYHLQAWPCVKCLSCVSRTPKFKFKVMVGDYYLW